MHGHAERLKGALQREGIDDSCQHSDVVAGYPIDPLFFSFFAAEDIAAAQYDPYLDAEIPDLLDLVSYFPERPVVYAAFPRHEGFAA